MPIERGPVNANFVRHAHELRALRDMQKIKQSKKLQLPRETIKLLTADQLAHAAGGGYVPLTRNVSECRC
jgi:hypothetical protein